MQFSIKALLFGSPWNGLLVLCTWSHGKILWLLLSSNQLQDGFLGNYTSGWKSLRNMFWALVQSLVVAAGGTLWGTKAVHYGLRRRTMGSHWEQGAAASQQTYHDPYCCDKILVRIETWDRNRTYDEAGGCEVAGARRLLALAYFTIYYTKLHYIALNNTTLHYTTRKYSKLHYTTLL